MSAPEHVALVDQLHRRSSDMEWLEFKRSHCAPDQLGPTYLSALAHSVCLEDQPKGYLVLGIEDETREVAGTDFNPYTAKGKGNQDLLPWLGAGLEPNPGFDVHLLDHPKGRVVVFEVAPARGQPVSFYRTDYVRIGEQ